MINVLTGSRSVNSMKTHHAPLPQLSTSFSSSLDGLPQHMEIYRLCCAIPCLRRLGRVCDSVYRLEVLHSCSSVGPSEPVSSRHTLHDCLVDWHSGLVLVRHCLLCC